HVRPHGRRRAQGHALRMHVDRHGPEAGVTAGDACPMTAGRGRGAMALIRAEALGEGRGNMRHGPVASVTAVGAAAAVYFLFARPWQLRWGATAQESEGPLPGDDLIVTPHLSATRAITVRAAAERVWPWIAQLGQGR